MRLTDDALQTSDAERIPGKRVAGVVAASCGGAVGDQVLAAAVEGWLRMAGAQPAAAIALAAMPRASHHKKTRRGSHRAGFVTIGFRTTPDADRVASDFDIGIFRFTASFR